MEGKSERVENKSDTGITRLKKNPKKKH